MSAKPYFIDSTGILLSTKLQKVLYLALWL